MIAEHGVTMKLYEARQMKENFLALLTQLDYDIKSGQVLPYKDMIEAVGNEYARMRTHLIAIAPEHGPRLRVLAYTTNDAEFVQALQEVVYEALEELSIDANNPRREVCLTIQPGVILPVICASDAMMFSHLSRYY